MRTKAQQGLTGVNRLDQHIGPGGDQITAPIIQCEQEPSRQVSQPGMRTQSSVQRSSQRQYVVPAIQTGQRGDEDVADALVSE